MRDHLISPEHAARLKALHDCDPNFGVIGHLWAPRIAAYMDQLKADTLLDYGAGRSNLCATVCTLRLVRRYVEYEPAFRGGLPQPADFVTCIDVLEHVEADKVAAVLSHIHSLMLKGGIITISLRNGTPRNRATHPSIHSRQWWINNLSHLFLLKEIDVLNPSKAASELAVYVEPKK